jgi:uroporphyrin-3 C-methyltransferase
MTATWRAEHAKLVDEIELLKRQQLVDKREQGLSGKQISKVVEDNQALWAALRQLQTQTASDPRPWQFAEAEYLLRIANHRLILQRDVTTAAAALKSADGVLRVIADPALQSVRQQLAKEQLALTSFEMPDLVGISARLITLSEQISELPLRGTYLNLKQLESNKAEEVTEEGWRGVLQGVWNELKTLVVISHNDKPVEALLPPQQAVNLQHNIQLQLENARLAVLKGESQVWQNSLSHAHSWLFDYFDVELPSVKSAIALLDELKKVDVAPEMPDISASLRMLQKQREALNYPQPGSVAQPAKPAAVESTQ